MMIKRLNPEGMHAPLGLYTHGIGVPAGASLLYISGQLGVRPDGTCGASIEEQADQVFANIKTVLAANDMAVTDIVKLTTFMVAGQSGDAVRAARLKYLGDHRPASTAVYVSRLVSEEWLVEIEAIAAKV